MFVLRKNNNHYVLQPSVNVAIDLGKAGIFSIPLSQDSNIDRLADNFTIDHKLDRQAREVIAEFLRKHQLDIQERETSNKQNRHTDRMVQRERNQQPEIHYSKFKQRLSKQTVGNITATRKSSTPSKVIKTSTMEETSSKHLTSRTIVKSVDLPANKQSSKVLEKLFRELNKHNKDSHKLSIDKVCFSGLPEKALQMLHGFFSKMSQRQVESLTLENFKALAKKYGLSHKLVRSRVFSN